MTFLKKLTSLQTFLLPEVALIIWPVFLGLSLHFSGFLVSHNTFLSWTLYILIGCYTLFIVALAIYFTAIKQYKKFAFFILGTVCTIFLLLAETALLFAIGLAGGATG